MIKVLVVLVSILPYMVFMDNNPLFNQRALFTEGKHRFLSAFWGNLDPVA